MAQAHDRSGTARTVHRRRDAGNDAPKFVLIGGGGVGWTPTLITDMALNPALKGLHVVLMDIDPKGLALVGPLCRKIVRALRADIRIEMTTDLDGALPGADFVGLTIRTGGFDGDRLDHEIPARYGVFQTVADTVGPGGWSRSLRNIPVVADIGRRVEKHAPNAWFMNYSNPMTVLTRTLQRVSRVRSMGICHELQGLLLHLAHYFGVDWQKDFAFSMAGINHLIWILKMTVKGQDAVKLLDDYVRDPARFLRLGKRGTPAELILSGGVGPQPTVKIDLYRRTGYLPAAGDAHIAEFFPYYLRPLETAKRWGFEPGKRAHTFARDWHGTRRQKCEAMLGGKLPLVLERSHEHADRTIAALSGRGESLLTPLNLANVGQIDNLPRAAVVETMAHVDANGIQPIAVGPLPDALLHATMQHIPTQEMIVEAGLTGNRDLAIAALCQDPLIPSPDIAVKIARDVFREFKTLLPPFRGRRRA